MTQCALPNNRCPLESVHKTLADSVSALLQEHYSQLLAYVRRQLWRDETVGDIATGAVDPLGLSCMKSQARASPNRSVNPPT